ncbi:hypothetical protein BU17DRAFT_97166 [Hysterangium stoloniferum]|nr:hypothetical protein BU17DRAFT_97166 [Hysterangium stoloniferum]
MIFTKESLSETTETPPAYEEVVPNTQPIPSDEKSDRGSSLRDTGTIQRSPNAVAGTSSGPPQSPWPRVNKRWYSWLAERDSDKQVKETVQSLIRDVVKESTSPAAASVLQSCLEACEARGLSFSTIMCQKFIEGHCPIYWVIVRRPSSEEQSNDQVDLLDILLSIPMDMTARSEAYLACLLVSDQKLFQRLRHVPGEGTSGPSGAYELLLGEGESKDEIQSFLGDPDAGEFRIIWKISQFQKRMRHIGSVSTEVVARGRIWIFAFVVLQNNTSWPYIKAGSWVAVVSVLAPSPSSDIYGRFRILDYKSPLLPSNQSQDGPEVEEESSNAKKPRRSMAWRLPPSPKVVLKPPIVLPCATSMTRIEPIQFSSLGADFQKHIVAPGKSVIIPLESHENGRSLQFDGSSYINPTGTLEVIFEGSLTKPKSAGEDCIIC